VLSGRGLCDELITRPEESYRLCCVVVCDLETSRMGAPSIYEVSRLRVKQWTVAYNLAGIRLEQIKLNVNLIGSPITTDCYVTWLPKALLRTSLLHYVQEYKSPFPACTFTSGEDGTQVDNMALSGELPQQWESQQQDP